MGKDAGDYVSHFNPGEWRCGHVKWFSNQHGYGFIVPDGGTTGDVFIHIVILRRCACAPIKEGQRVDYVPQMTQRGLHAMAVRRCQCDNGAS